MNFTYNSESIVLKVYFLPVSACKMRTDNSENKFTNKILLQASQAGVQLSVCAVICMFLHLLKLFKYNVILKFLKVYTLKT